MNKEELQEVLKKHIKWLNNQDSGKRANLQDANLRGANLQDANLQDANLQGANLHGADLRDAYLHGADLRDADLRGANLRHASLRGANLRGADLQYAYLFGANLRDVNLRGADLFDADLRSADLRDADLVGTGGIPLTCPEEGAFIGWKKAYKDQVECLVKLEIPADAKRSSATGRKCRCDKAEVLEIYTMDGKVFEETVYSGYDNDFLYEKGKTVSADNFEEDRWLGCAPGIHFFITKQEAINH
jgi:Uncharacterized low-complexity proteins|nr:MAG TPA: pentapeptide repeat protein [Caudoviricetes sp.]